MISSNTICIIIRFFPIVVDYIFYFFKSFTTYSKHETDFKINVQSANVLNKLTILENNLVKSLYVYTLNTIIFFLSLKTIIKHKLKNNNYDKNFSNILSL